MHTKHMHICMHTHPDCLSADWPRKRIMQCCVMWPSPMITWPSPSWDELGMSCRLQSEGEALNKCSTPLKIPSRLLALFMKQSSHQSKRLYILILFGLGQRVLFLLLYSAVKHFIKNKKGWPRRPYCRLVRTLTYYAVNIYLWNSGACQGLPSFKAVVMYLHVILFTGVSNAEAID